MNTSNKKHMKSWADYIVYGDDDVSIGDESNVAHTVLYKRSLHIGRHTFIDDHAYMTCHVKLGSFIHIAPFVYMIGGEGLVHIGDYSGLSCGCKIMCCTDDYVRGGLQHPAIPSDIRDSSHVQSADIVIGKGVLLGTGTCVLPGVLIPNGVSTGINTVITKSMKLKPWHYYDASGREIPRRGIDKAREICGG